MDELAVREEWIRRTTFLPLSQRETLELVLAKVKEHGQNDSTPIVVIDLDSTLYDVRHRTHQIIQSWLQVAQDLPDEIQQKLKNSTLSSIGYSLKDTFHQLELDLKNLQIEKTWERLKDYWWEHFFSNETVHHDEPYTGAIEYAHLLKEAGAIVVYLTGRDTPKMGAGTAKKMQKDGFPLDGIRARLIMKETFGSDDALHKVSVLNSLISEGTIIASFENEPKNLMALVDTLPSAMHIFVETSCSDHPARPGQGLYRIKDFSMTT